MIVSHEIKITLKYALLGALWILFSDQLIAILSAPFAPGMLTTLQTVKGWVFVAFTALFLYLILKKDVGHIRAAERSAQKSDQRFAMLVENLNGMVYRSVNDPGRPMTFVSANTRSLTGYTPEQVTANRSFFYIDLIDPADRQQVWETIQTALANNRPFQATYRIRTSTNAEKWVWEQGCGVYGPNGSVTGIEGIITDITEHKNAENQYQEIREIVNASPMVACLWKFAPSWPVQMISDNVLDLCGYRAEDFIAGRLNFTDIIYPGDLESLNTDILGHIKAKRKDSYTQQYRIITRQGAIRWMEDRTLIRRNDQGRITHFQGVIFDITDKKMSEERLQRKKELLQTIMDNIPLMIVSMAADGRLQWVNRAWEQAFGWTLAEAQLQDIMTAMYPDPQERRAVAHFVHSAQSRWELFPSHTRNGTVLETFWINSALSDGTKISIGQDLTEANQAEKNRRDLEAQLRQSQKMEAVGRLAGGVAHDFNNLLSVIIGYAELLQSQQTIAQPHGDHLLQILEAANRAKNLTRQLLAFGRKQMLEIKVLDVNAVIRGFEKLMRRMLSEDIAIDLSLSHQPCMISADLSQLEQILLNLVINARDAMPQGGTLTIETTPMQIDEAYHSAKPEVFPGAYIMIGISDTGGGMAADILDHIFEPFFTTKDEESGTGLGLSTVYGIVKQHKGHIWVYSEPNQGTAFKIYLPQSAQVPKAIAEPADSAPQRAWHAPATVLVVEDNAAVREVTCTMLACQGLTVHAAAEGAAAVAIARDHAGAIDLLVTDVVMPEIKGPEVYDRILPFQPNIKVLYMSGYTENVIFKQGVLQKGLHFIQKPFSMKDLAAKVIQILDR